MDYISDPTIYPVVFSFDRRNLVIIDNKFSTVSFKSQNDTIQNGLYFYENKYTLDVDLNDEKKLCFVKNRKKCIYEFMSNTNDVSNLNFYLKIWKDSSSFSVYNDGNNADVRLYPWTDSYTPCLFYNHQSMKQFLPVVDDYVSYYPSANVEITFNKKYKESFVLSDFVLAPGESLSKNIIDSANYGVLFIVVRVYFDWFYDESRTLPVSSVPSSIEIEDRYFSSRIFLWSSGYFPYGASTNNGLCIVSGVLTKDYLTSISGSYGSFHSIIKEPSGVVYFKEEASVIVDNNGYCAKEGFLSKIYYL